MSLSSVFANLVRGPVRVGKLGLRIEREEDVVYGAQYSYAELKLGKAVLESSGEEGQEVTAGKRGQTLHLIPTYTVQPTDGYHCLVSVNPELQKYASGVPQVILIQPSTTPVEIPIWITLRRDLDLTTLGWLVRVYAVY